MILNTCHIREKAAEKVFSELGRLRVLKEERAAAGVGSSLAVAGCVAQAEGQEILRRAPASISSSVRKPIIGCPRCWRGPHGGGAVIETDFPAEDKFDPLPDAAVRAAA